MKTPIEFRHFLELVKKPNWPEAFSLIILLYYHGAFGSKVTKKLCKELMGSESKSKKAIECIEFYWAFNFTTWELLIPDYTRVKEVDPIVERDLTIAWLINKELPSNFNVLVGLLKYQNAELIESTAKKFRYSLDEFIPIFIREVKKDEFWKNILTAETLIRKFHTLLPKVEWKIPKKTWWLGELNHIF